MIKSIFHKVMWVGRAAVFTVGLAVTLALMLGVTTAALAAAPGDPFKLGKINTLNRLSTLVGSTANAMLKVDNNGTGTALDLQVQPGKAPMKVNSDTQVANLNADRLDGNTAENFYFYDEKVNDSEKLDGKDSTNFLTSSVYSRQAQGTGNAGTTNALIASCDPGDLALSAGYWIGEDTTIDTISNFVRADGRLGGSQGSWALRWFDRAPATYYELTVYCADTTP